MRIVRNPLPGDFNGDDVLDASDIDQLRGDITDPKFDLNEDGRIDQDDRAFWVSSLANTYFGDADLNGEFNSSDFAKVFLVGEYEDAIDDNSGWAEGDWDGDGDFTSGDFVAAFLDGGYERGPRPVAAVPEPSAYLLTALALLTLSSTRRQ